MVFGTAFSWIYFQWNAQENKQDFLAVSLVKNIFRNFERKARNMKNSNIIGLKETDCKKIAEKLNELLADYSIFYQNTRGAHWNIKGDQFFTLHIKFEELYDNLVLKIDEIAERILTLGYTPNHNFSDYIQLSTIKESKEVSDGTKCVENILSSFKTLFLIKAWLRFISVSRNKVTSVSPFISI